MIKPRQFIMGKSYFEYEMSKQVFVKTKDNIFFAVFPRIRQSVIPNIIPLQRKVLLSFCIILNKIYQTLINFIIQLI